MTNRIRIRPLILPVVALLSGAAQADAPDPFALMAQLPAPPSTLDAARAATELDTQGTSASLSAAAYAAHQARLTAATTQAATPHGSVAGFDMARASSDPAYAAEMQQKMQNMSVAERMALAQQMAASRGGGAATGQVAAFVAQQRSADEAARTKIRTLMDTALNAAGAKHKAADDALNAEAKTCPQDKTGWPVDKCTAQLGEKSIAAHRAIEASALPDELKAYNAALAVANAELAKGKNVFSQLQGPSDQRGPLVAWALLYVQLMHDYGEAVTLRAGFWSHADHHKYTGLVKVYAGEPSLDVGWPLAKPSLAHQGL